MCKEAVWKIDILCIIIPMETKGRRNVGIEVILVPNKLKTYVKKIFNE